MKNLADYYTPEEFFETFVWLETKDYALAESASPFDNTRWSIIWQHIIQNISTGLYYRITWEVPATELQDQDLEDRMMSIETVVPVKVETTVYISKEEMDKI